MRARPLAQRRVRLEDIVAGNELVFPVRRLTADGHEAWKQVIERGYEGYVAKDESSPYESGATPAVAQGETEGLDHRRRPLDPTNRRGAVSDRLLLDFDAFFLEHRCCGDLSGGTDDERVWLACVASGARIERPVSE